MSGLYLQNNGEPYCCADCGSDLIEILDAPYCPKCDADSVRRRINAIFESEDDAANTYP
jgi:hypothetical protein